MSYQVLALKYRPQTFEDVIGQSHVTATLSNAITINRVAHAILFTGPRGTGKTTIARILAKAMNCANGPVVTPCNQCKTCREIIDGHCPDVFEIDGASNNSVDQIRDLRENVTYMPSTAQYKIYIIDEVHMLSTAAFNALLKTLEEPPGHVLFIFATTEVHKIPATILSRCQRHDLGRIDLQKIAGHLKKIGEKEGYRIESRTLDLIAMEADGSIRDALSLFDRVLSSCPDKKVDHDHVLDTLGILDQQILHEVAHAIIEKNGAKLIAIIDKINHCGIDFNRFYSDIIIYFRNLSIIKHCGRKNDAINIADSQADVLDKLAHQIPGGFISDILNILLKEETLLKYSSHTRFSLEMILLRLLDLNPGAHIDRIIEKIDALAVKLKQMPIHAQAVQSVSKNTLPPKKRPVHDHVIADRPDKEQAGNDFGLNQSAPNFKGNDMRPGTDMADPGDAPKTLTQFLKKVEATFPFMFALLKKGKVKELDNKIIVELTGCSSFDIKRIESKKSELVQACKNDLDKDLDIVVLSESSTVREKQDKKNKMEARQAALNHPLVLKAQELFDGKILNY